MTPNFGDGGRVPGSAVRKLVSRCEGRGGANLPSARGCPESGCHKSYGTTRQETGEYQAVRTGQEHAGLILLGDHTLVLACLPVLRESTHELYLKNAPGNCVVNLSICPLDPKTPSRGFKLV